MTNERALISQIIDGDVEAFRVLIKEHERLVLHMIGRVVKSVEDREELCQDVFLKVHSRIAEFNFQSKLSTWIATIAYRQAINHIRKKKIPITDWEESEGFQDRFIASENPAEEYAEKDLEEKVLGYIDQLPVHYRTILTMYHLDGLTYPEIGEITGMPEGTVKNYLFRARNLLKEKLSRYIGTEELR